MPDSSPSHDAQADTPAETQETSASIDTSSVPIGKILRCFSGAFMAGILAVLMYRFTLTIATTLANKPIASDNVTAINIAAAVRTLVIGIVALGAGVFGMTALGLFLLGVQWTWQRTFAQKKLSSEN